MLLELELKSMISYKIINFNPNYCVYISKNSIISHYEFLYTTMPNKLEIYKHKIDLPRYTLVGITIHKYINK